MIHIPHRLRSNRFRNISVFADILPINRNFIIPGDIMKSFLHLIPPSILAIIL